MALKTANWLNSKNETKSVAVCWGVAFSFGVFWVFFFFSLSGHFQGTNAGRVCSGHIAQAPPTRESEQPGASELVFQHSVKRASPSMWAITQGSGPCGRAGPGSLEWHCLSRQQLEISWTQRRFVSEERRALDTQRGGIFSLVRAGDSGLSQRVPARRAAGWRGCWRGEHSEMLSLNNLN